MIWQEWEANGEHQYPLHGSARPFSSTNSFFFNQEASQAQDSSGLLFLYIALLLFSSTAWCIWEGAFGFWGFWWASVLSTSPEWTQLCSVLTNYVYSAEIQGLKCTIPWAPTFLLNAFTWFNSSYTFFLKPGSPALPPLCTFGNQLCRENFADLTARGTNVSCKSCSDIFKSYRPKSKRFALVFLSLLSLNLGSLKINDEMMVALI